MLIHGVRASWGRWFAWLGAGVLAGSLLVGLGQFWRSDPTYLRCVDCPEWATQVDRYEQGDGSLVIWPYDDDEPWVMELPPGR
jgi:hypothetical protein